MTQIKLDEPVDEESFQSGLAELLETATQNGVSVERAWECCIGGEEGWEVEIVRLLSNKRTD
jgi:hypothetical protein